MMRRPMFRARDVVVPANRRRSGQSGMGLIELMIAMVVLMVGMLGSMIMVIAGMQSNTRNRNDTSAVVLDQEILEKFATLKNYPKTGVAIINDCALAGTNQHLAALVQAPAPGAGAVLFTAGTAPTPVQVGDVDWTQPTQALAPGAAQGYGMGCRTSTIDLYAVRWRRRHDSPDARNR